jgi:hypothetical protein
MTVDGSYMAWVRPTRRVHLALSAGMTVTGLILTVFGMTGSGGAAPSSPRFGRSADSVVTGDSGRPAGTGAVAPAPMVRFAPAAPAAPRAKPHTKPASPAAPTPHHAPHPSDVTRLPVPAPAPARAPAPALPRAVEKLPQPSPSPHPSPEPRPVHPAKH